MAHPIPQIFISSTSEFHDERQLVAKAIRDLTPRCEPFIYEEETPRGASPKSRCAEEIDESEVVVLILGEKYGSSFPDDPDKSIVEWEYDYARERDRALQAYVKEADGAVIEPRQKAFVARVTDFSKGSWVKPFRAAQELVAMVQNGVVAWRNACWALLLERRPERVRWVDRLLVPLAVMIAVGTLAAVGAGVFIGASTSALMILSGTGLGVLLVFLPLLKSPPV